MIIAIDFDGTIVEHKFPKVGDPLPGAIDAIKKLILDGHLIIIWTCRYYKEHLDDLEKFLQMHFDKLLKSRIKINDNWSVGFYPEPKIYADVYIDDRNLGGLPPWDQIYKTIKMYELLRG